jgi:DnaK suppressor protein
MTSAELRQRLLAEKRELEEASASTIAERQPVDADLQTVGRIARMDSLQNQAMAVEAERRRQARIRRVDAALARIDSGEYGACVRCGEDIDPRRLELDPTTPLCTRCAA